MIQKNNTLNTGMAYNVIPKTFEEAGKAVKHMDTVRAAEALRLFNVLTEKYGNILPDPIAFDPGNKSVCKISRQLVGSFTIRDIKSQLKIKNLQPDFCLLYTSPSPRDVEESRMPSSA